MKNFYSFLIALFLLLVLVPSTENVYAETKQVVESAEEHKDSYNGLAIGADGNWYYYVNGVVDTGYTGFVCDQTVGWWLVRNGMIDFGYTGLYGDVNYGWWLVQGGTICFGYSGLYGDANYGWWLVESGTINFGYAGLYYDPYVGWWLVNGGTINFGYSGLYCDPYVGWWLINGGTVDFGYTGLVQNEYGIWYVSNGAIDWNFTGKVEKDGVIYNVVNGSATIDTDGNTGLSAKEVYSKIIAMKEVYPEGMPWTNDNFYGWKGGIFSGGYGCAGFAFALSDAAFDDLPAYIHYDFYNLKVGDIVRDNYDTHSVVVLEVHDDYIIVAEGNYNRSVHWGRKISISSIESEEGNYVISRYP